MRYNMYLNLVKFICHKKNILGSTLIDQTKKTQEKLQKRR